ncbi:MAG: RcnB family protein [Planctomycetes bacterium]|jgi:Ni/Co efflux regulator RcnB|nr:RcnB family protein [Planctomycetota bacterium]
MKTLAGMIVALCLYCALAQVAVADVSGGVVFTQEEVRIIASWYDEHGRATAEGSKSKGKPKGLPPGIARNLARGKALPPGIAKQMLPKGLVSALPSPPPGYERIIVDGRVLLVEVATQVIHDVLTDLVVK